MKWYSRTGVVSLLLIAPTAVIAAAPTPPVAHVAVKGTRIPPIYSVVFSPDGKRLVAGGYKRLTIYDTETGKALAQWVVAKDAIHSVAFSPDGKQIAIGSGIPATEGSATVIDAETGKLLKTVGDHDDTVESVAFAGNTLLSASDDETVEISDLATGKTVGTLREHVGRCLSVMVPTKISDNDGGNLFVTSGADNLVKIWDVDKRRVVVNFDQAQGPVWSVAAFPRPGRFITASSDGHLRWLGVYTERERQLPNGDKEAIVPPPGEPQPRGGYVERDIMAHEGGVYSVAPAPNDQFIASGGADDKVVLWNLGGGKIREFLDAEGDILSVAVSPDSKRVASASMDGHTRLYDVEKGTLLWTYPAVPLNQTQEGVGTGIGLSVSFFGNRNLTGIPVLKRIGDVVDFNYSAAGPGPGLANQEFSARWEGFYEAPANGTYRFLTRSDDGVRLTVNGKMVIDNWTDHGTTDDTMKEPIRLRKGQRIPIKLEYYQGTGGAEIHLFVTRAGQEMKIVPKDRLFPLDAPKPPPVTPVATPPVTKAKSV